MHLITAPKYIKQQLTRRNRQIHDHSGELKYSFSLTDKKTRAGGVVQVVECLTSNHKALSKTTSTTTINKKEKKKGMKRDV
jgi:hypothetical protein